MWNQVLAAKKRNDNESHSKIFNLHNLHCSSNHQIQCIKDQVQLSLRIWFSTSSNSFTTEQDNNLGNVVDLARGDGNYSRLISDYLNYYYTNLIGIDVSQSQINLANTLTNSNKYPKISYDCLNVLDCKNKYDSYFDTGIAVWLFNYATNKTELKKYVESSYNILKNDGYLIGIPYSNINFTNIEPIGIIQNEPKFEFEIYPSMINNRKDGKNVVCEGAITTVLGLKNDYRFEFETYLYNYNTYESTFKQCGFKHFYFLPSNEWINAIQQFGLCNQIEQEYWTQLVSHKSNVFATFVAQK